MGDVFEYLIDGTSGIVNDNANGKALVAGVCSRGTVGKAYLVGARSDLGSLLGTGPLVDRVRDMLLTAGQDPYLIAVPVKGQSGGYISGVQKTGTKVDCTVTGVPAQNADVIIRVTSGGAVGTAKVQISSDGGAGFGDETTSAASLGITKGSTPTGVTISFPSGASLDESAEYSFSIRTPVGPVTRVGDTSSPLITVTEADGVLDSAELVLQVIKNGALNEGTYRLSVDGGDNFGSTRTIPADGTLTLSDYGVKVTFPEGIYVTGTTYTCELLAPAPTIADVFAALEEPLSVYDVEFVYIAGPSDSVDWAAAEARAEELWNVQRPTYFKMEARLPYAGEDVSAFTTAMVAERQGLAARFVTVCAQYGEVTETGGLRRFRNAGALQAGRVMSIPVQRATGRVKDGPVSPLALPDDWSSAQKELEDAGYITARSYCGMDGTYWGDARTIADSTSDFRYEEVLRTVFKAVRLTRIAALKSMYDEAGDPLRPSSTSGLAYLRANLETALDAMTTASPQELAGYVVDIPDGQDIVNNGVSVEITLVGIPIIRQIKLYNSYVYAGTTFDPRSRELY